MRNTEVGIPGLVKTIKDPFSHSGDLVSLKSQDGCSPASIASAFQAGRRGRADGERQIPAAPVLFQGASWKLSSVTSAYISLTRTVSYCHPSLSTRLGNRLVLAGRVLALNTIGILM